MKVTHVMVPIRCAIPTAAIFSLPLSECGVAGIRQ